MSRQFVIEIEEEPFHRESALYGEEAHFRAKGFKSLVFDKEGLDKLIPLDQCAGVESVWRRFKEEYERGFNDALRAATDTLNERWKKTTKYDGTGRDIAEDCEIYINTLRKY